MKKFKQFSKFEKVQKTTKTQKSAQKKKKKKLENKTEKQKTRPYRKNTGRSLMGRDPYHFARGWSEQRRARRRSIEISRPLS
jgi:hypothetical protein